MNVSEDLSRLPISTTLSVDSTPGTASCVDGIDERADPVDRDPDQVGLPEAEFVGRDDPGSGQQDHAVGEDLSRPSQSISSSKRRAIRPTEVRPSKTVTARRVRSSRRISTSRIGGMAAASVIHGPRAQQAS